MHSLLLGGLMFSFFPLHSLRIGAKKLLKNVARIRRDGSRMAELVSRDINFVSTSNHAAVNAIRQAVWAEALLARLDADAAAVVAEFAAFQRALTASQHLRIQVRYSLLCFLSSSQLKRRWSATFKRFLLRRRRGQVESSCRRELQRQPKAWCGAEC